jgi:crossover junction endodeoxyribonuclease RusA
VSILVVPDLVVVKLPAGLDLINANQRLHHQKRAQYTREIRNATAYTVLGQRALKNAINAARPGPLYDRVHILGIVHPDRAGRFDPPNWYGSFKASVDALVDVGLIADDDHTHVVGPDMRPGHPVKGGQIELHIRPIAPGQQWPDIHTLTAAIAA